MSYQIELWKRQDWRKGSRHYSCEVKQDLFGQWIVLRRWGRVSAFQGQSQGIRCEYYEQSLKIFDATAQRRIKRGYIEW